ncbi:hypothetical protein MJO28_003155 [Puccinia striiformis f. sp. tritici]|uniref:Uncharacterized protein n=1 Tax=Puccinia striiformis f. sp. tritici TaxID=168172 RepID=A0ACC0ESQ3_9BASI|nr:hypothetical protein MJO28_003155 [Puccinia striiformis f. sp. tritici]
MQIDFADSLTFSNFWQITMQAILFLISLITSTKVPIVTSSPTYPSETKDFQRPTLSPTTLKLSKRGSLTDETGLLDQKTLDNHLRYSTKTDYWSNELLSKHRKCVSIPSYDIPFLHSHIRSLTTRSSFQFGHI